MSNHPHDVLNGVMKDIRRMAYKNAKAIGKADADTVGDFIQAGVLAALEAMENKKESNSGKTSAYWAYWAARRAIQKESLGVAAVKLPRRVVAFLKDSRRDGVDPYMHSIEALRALYPTFTISEIRCARDCSAFDLHWDISRSVDGVHAEDELADGFEILDRGPDVVQLDVERRDALQYLFDVMKKHLSPKEVKFLRTVARGGRFGMRKSAQEECLASIRSNVPFCEDVRPILLASAATAW